RRRSRWDSRCAASCEPGRLNAKFVARSDGGLERSRPREQRRQPSGGARDFEERARARSAQRIALADAAPIIRKAPRWRERHDALDRRGRWGGRKGSAAILWVGKEPVRASSAGRECSMSALEKRLGEFKPGADDRSPDSRRRAPRPIDPASKPWKE